MAASSRSLKLLKNLPSNEWNSNTRKGNEPDSDECSLSSSTPSSSCHTTDSILESKNSSPVKGLQSCASDFSNSPVKESDILSDEEDNFQQLLKKSNPTKDIEIQFQRLQISEIRDDDVETAYPPGLENRGGPRAEEQPKLIRAHFCPIKRKVNSTRRDKGTLRAMQEQHLSLDNQPDSPGFDLNSILEREFSVQSLTSVVNEDCFYEAGDRHGKS